MDINTIKEGIESNIEAGSPLDYIMVHENVNTITRVSSLVLGILVIVILILIPIIVTLELVYICMPIARSAFNKVVYDSSPGFLQHTFQFTLRDGIKAVEIAYTKELGESTALWVYAKIKIKAILLEVFLIYFVVGSGPNILINLFMRVFSGIVKGIFGVSI